MSAPLDLDALEAVLTKMTEGPWNLICDGDDIDRFGVNSRADNAGVVALRNAAPALIAEVRRLRSLLDPENAGSIERMARAIHDTDDMADTVWPDGDGDDGDRGGGAYVRVCQDPEIFRSAARAALRAMQEARK